MPALKYHDVFVPGGYPRHTYNPRIELQLEQRLSESRRNLCKLVTVVGQTKSAKTVLARKVLPRDECVWVDGGTVAAESEENRAVVQGSIAYFGTYSLNETEKVSTLQLEGSTFANLMGGGEHRRIVTTLTADELKFTNPRTPSGATLEVVWKRAK